MPPLQHELFLLLSRAQPPLLLETDLKQVFLGRLLQDFKDGCCESHKPDHRGENLQEIQATPRKPVEPGWEPETMSGLSDLLLTIPIHTEYHYHRVLNEELSQPKLSKVTEPKTKPQPSDPNVTASVAFTTAWTLFWVRVRTASQVFWKDPLNFIHICVLES